jgi:hypothetical protein
MYATNFTAQFVSLELIKGKGKGITVTRYGKGGVEL